MKEGKKISQSVVVRPPIVVVLGHVDHGKTTLLDVVRNSSIANKEAGGITQSIGVSQVATKDGNKITFIDTPGHSTFKKMRSRGAKFADIALLVVAADDGVKPQTLEALKYIKKEKIPYIVVISKIDLKTSNIEKARGQLEKEGVVFENKGGDTPLVMVSAKGNKGIEDLLELVVLVSEVNEIKGKNEDELEATVIETSKDHRGPLASLVIRSGKLCVGDSVSVDDISARIRGIFSPEGLSVKEVNSGDPCLVLGFARLPCVGAVIKKQKEKVRNTTKDVIKKTQVGAGDPDQKKIPLVIKTQSAGSLEDLVENLPDEVVVIYSSVGDVNESDVFMAKSAYPARIFVFESKIPTSVLKLAETEGVKIERFEVIYELFDRVGQIIKDKEIKILGKAEILAKFPYNKDEIAGSKMIKGEINKSSTLILERNSKELGEVKVISIKKQKQEVEKVKEGEEFGLLFKPQLDFKVGDMIVSVRR